MVVGSESFWELYREYLLNASKVNLGGTSVSRESVSARAFSRKIENQQLLDNYCSCTFRAHPTLDLIDLISESDSDSDSKANPGQGLHLPLPTHTVTTLCMHDACVRKLTTWTVQRHHIVVSPRLPPQAIFPIYQLGQTFALSRTLVEHDVRLPSPGPRFRARI